MNLGEKSAKIKTLMNDDTFKDIISEIVERQVAIFMDAYSETNERDRAHDIVCAINEITNYMESVVADDKISKRKRKK
jgi:hypothetical protein